MTLSIQSIAFHDFRSYDQLRLDSLGPLTVFVGPNAVGKTNIVEGIQLLTALASFRHPTIEQMVRHGAPVARLSAHMSDGSRELDVDLRLEGHTKRYSLNGKAKKTADLKGLVPSVTFTPDDLDLVKGSMSVRRKALDALGSQLSANYYLILKDYEKVLHYKNRLLKEEASEVMIDSIDEMLVTVGAQLSCYRASLFARLEPQIARRYGEIAGSAEKLRATYRPSWDDGRAGVASEPGADRGELTRDAARTALEEALVGRRAEERARRRAVVGPHGDTISFSIDGMDATLYGSQGQQRSVVLACKLAEAAVIEEVLDQKPVLLLDDVMSELDEARRSALVSYISDDVQTFITTANLAYFDERMLSAAQVVSLPIAE